MVDEGLSAERERLFPINGYESTIANYVLGNSIQRKEDGEAPKNGNRGHFDFHVTTRKLQISLKNRGPLVDKKPGNELVGVQA